MIADKALEFKLGARGLRSICEAILTEAMYDMPSQPDVSELIIDGAYIQEQIKNSKFNFLKAA